MNIINRYTKAKSEAICKACACVVENTGAISALQEVLCCFIVVRYDDVSVRTSKRVNVRYRLLNAVH